MFDALPAGSTSVFTMRSPGLLGTPTKLVGLFTPPQTTALVTSHLPFLLGSTTSQPLKSFPFSRGFHPLSVRYSECSPSHYHPRHGHLPFEQSSPGARGRRATSVRSGRYRNGNQISVCAGDEAPA